MDKESDHLNKILSNLPLMYNHPKNRPFTREDRPIYQTSNLGNPSFFELVKDIQSTELTVADLFKHYEDVGFMYPAKKERIAPHMHLITNNWATAMQMDKEILWTNVFRRSALPQSHMASLSFWRTTYNSWIAQHLTCTGFPAGVVSVLLNSQAQGALRIENNKSCQMWYSHTNKYARKLYGSMVDAVGQEYAANIPLNYYAVTFSSAFNSSDQQSKSIEVIPCSNDQHNDIYDLAVNVRGRIYAEAEELGEEDLQLKGLDSIYSQAGLRRRRQIWTAYTPGTEAPVGAVVCYRGPFGFNFSLLENRCDLLIKETLDDDTTEAVCWALISRAASSYRTAQDDQQYPLTYFPVATCGRSGKVLEKMGAGLMREYNQCICMREGFDAYYHHIENVFDTIVAHMKKQALREQRK